MYGKDICIDKDVLDYCEENGCDLDEACNDMGLNIDDVVDECDE